MPTSSTTRYRPTREAHFEGRSICLNPTKRWKIGFDGDISTYDLRYTIAHEIGHAIGLDHPNGPGQIMGYRYEERFRQLQAGDVQGAMLIYGGRAARRRHGFRGVPCRAEARPLAVTPNVGELEPSPHVLPELGLHSSGDFDMGRGLVLWLVGIPLPVILILYFLGYLH